MEIPINFDRLEQIVNHYYQKRKSPLISSSDEDIISKGEHDRLEDLERIEQLKDNFYKERNKYSNKDQFDIKHLSKLGKNLSCTDKFIYIKRPIEIGKGIKRIKDYYQIEQIIYDKLGVKGMNKGLNDLDVVRDYYCQYVFYNWLKEFIKDKEVQLLNAKKSDALSMKQQAIFAYLLNKHDILKLSKFQDSTDKVRLLFWLSNQKPPEKINNNVNIYKFLNEIFKYGLEGCYSNLKYLIKDLTKVGNIFKALQLDTIVQDVQSMIERLELKTK